MTGGMVMHIGVLFLLAVLARAATRIWLANRQIAAVDACRSEVPWLFEGRISVAHHERAADYMKARMRAGRVGTLAGAATALALTFGGGIAGVDALWRLTPLEQPWLGAAVVLTVLGLLQLVELPFSIWRTFKLEARFGFNRTSRRLFAGDLAKRTAVGALVMAPLTVALILLMQRGGPWWWLFAWLGWLAVAFTLSWAWPRVVAPLFNRFVPLGDPALEVRLEALLERCGFRSGGVLVMDGSRRSAHGNAYLTGIGRNKRIVFFDTLLERLGTPEIEAVLAHELGHFRLRHTGKRLAVSALLALAGLAGLAWLSGRASFYSALGVAVPSPHAALLLFIVAVPAFTFLLTPVRAWWSRRHELEADDFAAAHTSRRDLASALVKISRDNASNLVPDPLYSAFYDTHPPAPERIARLGALDPEDAGPKRAGDAVLQ